MRNLKLIQLLYSVEFKKKVISLTILFIGLVGTAILYQNCAPQTFFKSKVDGKPCADGGDACIQCNFDAATIVTQPTSHYQLNNPITFSIDESQYEEIEWHFFTEDDLGNRVEMPAGFIDPNDESPSATFTQELLYVAVATVRKPSLGDCETTDEKYIDFRPSTVACYLPTSINGPAQIFLGDASTFSIEHCNGLNCYTGTVNWNMNSPTPPDEFTTINVVQPVTYTYPARGTYTIAASLAGNGTCPNHAISINVTVIGRSCTHDGKIISDLTEFDAANLRQATCDTDCDTKRFKCDNGNIVPVNHTGAIAGFPFTNYPATTPICTPATNCSSAATCGIAENTSFYFRPTNDRLCNPGTSFVSISPISQPAGSSSANAQWTCQNPNTAVDTCNGIWCGQSQILRDINGDGSAECYTCQNGGTANPAHNACDCPSGQTYNYVTNSCGGGTPTCTATVTVNLDIGTADILRTYTRTTGQTLTLYTRGLSSGVSCNYICNAITATCQSNGQFNVSFSPTTTYYEANNQICTNPCPGSCQNNGTPYCENGTSYQNRTCLPAGATCTAGCPRLNLGACSVPGSCINSGTPYCENGRQYQDRTCSPVGAICAGGCARTDLGVGPCAPAPLSPQIIFSKSVDGPAAQNFNYSTDYVYGRILNLLSSDVGCATGDAADPSHPAQDSGFTGCTNNFFVNIGTNDYSSGAKHWAYSSSTWRTTPHNGNRLYGHELFIPGTFRTYAKNSSGSEATAQITIRGNAPDIIISKTSGGADTATFNYNTDSFYVRVNGLAPTVRDYQNLANTRGCIAADADDPNHPAQNINYCNVGTCTGDASCVVEDATAAYTNGRYIDLPKDDWSCSNGGTCEFLGLRRLFGSGLTYKLSESSAAVPGAYKLCIYNKFYNVVRCKKITLTGTLCPSGQTFDPVDNRCECPGNAIPQNGSCEPQTCPAGQGFGPTGTCMACTGSGYAIGQDGRCYTCGTANMASMLSFGGITPPPPETNQNNPSSPLTICNQGMTFPQLGAYRLNVGGIQGNNQIGWGWACPSGLGGGAFVSCFRAYGCQSGELPVNGNCAPTAPVAPQPTLHGCYIDTHEYDISADGGQCFSQGCTATNVIVYSLGDVRTPIGVSGAQTGEGFRLSDPSKYAITWTGPCSTSTSDSCSITRSVNGVYNTTATVRRLSDNQTWTYSFSAEKSTVYRASAPLNCPPIE